MQTRQKNRKALAVPGRYSTGRGEPVSVELRDLSVGGCRFAGGGDELGPGARLQVVIAGRGPYRATIKWCAKGEVGVTFATPLPTETFHQFQNSHVADFSDEGTPGEFEPMAPQAERRFC